MPVAGIDSGTLPRYLHVYGINACATDMPARLGEDGCGVEGGELEMLRGMDWKLAGPEPDDWRPRVTLHPSGGAEVEFYTCSGLGICQAIKHVDRYFQGYSFSSRHEVVLEGGLGYLF